MTEQPNQAPSPEHLSELLPQYNIERFIAQGGMGAVYKGRQISLDRDVAIKILLQDASESAEFQELFISEAKAMAKLNHPNLLGVFDFGTVEGMSYIVMEYVVGGSLHQAAFNQRIDSTQAVTIIKGICDGLSHAHKNGIVHRDIKPANILLTPDAEPKVADFGLAHAGDSEKSGQMMGTPGYTAPEVFNHPEQAGKVADIYSVGVILHQLLSGIDPAGSMLPPSQLINNTRLDAIWRKATHIIPNQRYQSITEMAKDLEKWLEAKGNILMTGNSAPVNMPRPGPAAPVVSHGGGNGMVIKVAAIFILSAITFFIYSKSKDNKEKNSGYQWVEDDTTLPIQEDPNFPSDIATLPPKDAVNPSVTSPTDLGTTEKPEVAMNNNLPEITPKPEPEPEVVPEVVPETKPEPEVAVNEVAVKLPLGDPALHARAIDLIADARKKRDKEFSQNADVLRASISAESKGAKPDISAFLDDLKDAIVKNRIPKIDNLEGLPQKLVDAHKKASAKDEATSAKHLADMTRIRDSYATRLKGGATETQEKDLQERLLAQAESAGDLDAWVQSLSPEPEPEAVKVVKRSSGTFVGNWDIHGPTPNIERWIGHPGGKVEVVGKTWVAEWVFLDDGTLEVRWDGKKPYVMKRVGDDWVGKAPFGHPTTFKPGNW